MATPGGAPGKWRRASRHTWDRRTEEQPLLGQEARVAEAAEVPKGGDSGGGENPAATQKGRASLKEHVDTCQATAI